MLKCLYCNELFDEPFIIKEMHSELECMPCEEIPVCPYCFDTDITQEKNIFQSRSGDND